MGGDSAHNEFSGTAHTVIQAHTIHGGIHFHDGRRPADGRRPSVRLLYAGCLTLVGVPLMVFQATSGDELEGAPGSLLGLAGRRC